MAHEQYIRAAFQALDDDWQTTQAIGRRMGLQWRAGSGRVLGPLRSALFALTVAELAAHTPQRNGHLWKRGPKA